MVWISYFGREYRMFDFLLHFHTGVLNAMGREIWKNFRRRARGQVKHSPL